jgi:hypothetical protein
LEAGEKLLTTPNLDTKQSIDQTTRQLQDTWKDTELQLGEATKQFNSSIEVNCHLLLYWDIQMYM